MKAYRRDIRFCISNQAFIIFCATAGTENVASQNVSAGQHPGTALRRDMQYERGPVVSGGIPEAGGGLQSKAGATQYESAHKAGYQNGSATDAITTGVAGVDVKQGEVIDRKFYTGREERPQEQVLGKISAPLLFDIPCFWSLMVETGKTFS